MRRSVGNPATRGAQDHVRERRPARAAVGPLVVEDLDREAHPVEERDPRVDRSPMQREPRVPAGRACDEVDRLEVAATKAPAMPV